MYRPATNGTRPTSISRSIGTLRRQLDLPDVDPLERIATSWADIVDAKFAEHCAPLFVRDRKLVVSVHDAAIAEHLRWSSTAMVDRVNALCGDSVIESISVRFSRS